MSRVIVACAAVLGLAGCLELDFDPPHLVKDDRMLAIMAEPPEIAFGEDVVFEALLVDGEGNDLSVDPDVELRFMVCISLAEVLSASGLGAQGLEDNCNEGGDDLVRLVAGEGDLPPNAARLSGSAILGLIEELMSAPPTGGGGEMLDPRLIETLAVVIAEVGVPLRVRLEVWRGGEMFLLGHKRFAITQREDPTTNPPPPRFAIDGVWMSARGEGADPHACVPEEGVMPSVVAEAEVEIAPDEDESWIEEYPALSIDGQLVTLEESAFYSWFSTGGMFSSDITQRPERIVTWIAPEEPGVYPVWVVVRDGHLGSSYCRADVQVVPGE